MSRITGRRRLAAALAGLAVIAVAGHVVASAASLGGLATDNLGAGSAVTQRITSVTLDWTPAWADAAWRIDTVELSPETDGSPTTFLTGDEVKIALPLTGGSVCEVLTTVSGGEPASLTIASDEFGAQCGTTPAFELIDGVAVAVTGADGVVEFESGELGSSLGELTGSLAAFGGPVLHPNRELGVDADVETATVEGVAYVDEIVLPVWSGADADDLAGESVAVVLRGAANSTEVTGEYAGVISADGSTGFGVETRDGSIVIVVSARFGDDSSQWARADQVGYVDAIVHTPQRIVASTTETPSYAVSLAGGDVDIELPTDGETEEPGGGHGDVIGSIRENKDLESGLQYRINDGQFSYSNNGLNFCWSFSVRNASTETMEWTLTLDTSEPPFWGMDPTTTSLGGQLRTVEYDAQEQLWTIGGVGWFSTLQPNDQRSLGTFCFTVPLPEPDPSQYHVEVELRPAGAPYDVVFFVRVTSPSQWRLPWRAEIDLADYVCASSLPADGPSFTRVNATRVAGSQTSWVISGMDSQDAVVGSGKSTEIEFARYSAGSAEWRLGSCPGGG